MVNPSSPARKNFSCVLGVAKLACFSSQKRGMEALTVSSLSLVWFQNAIEGGTVCPQAESAADSDVRVIFQ